MNFKKTADIRADYLCNFMSCCVFAQLEVKLMNQTLLTEDMNSHHPYRGTESL